MKIMAVILLVLGIGLTALGAGLFFSADYENCKRDTATAEKKLNEARAAQGTAREAELMEEARIEVDSQESSCRNANRTTRSAMVAGPGGITTIIVSALLFVVSRKRRTSRMR